MHRLKRSDRIGEGRPFQRPAGTLQLSISQLEEPGDFGTASLTPGSEAAALFAQQLGGSAALSLAVVDLAAVVGWLRV